MPAPCVRRATKASQRKRGKPPTAPITKPRVRPNIATKLAAARLAEETSVEDVHMATGYSISAIKTWVKTKETLLGFKGSKTRKKNTGDSGKAPIIPGQDALAIYLRDLRRQELAITASHMFEFLREHHMDWIQNYMATRATGYKSLLRLLAYYGHRHGLSQQRSCRQKKTQEDLKDIQASFGKEFHAKHGDTALDCIYNADETGIYYDMCPKTIWAVRGGGSYVANTETHSYRMTALLTVRADGKKLPILFVIRGADG
ncbi:hypothetical protein As57867_007526, partial [Aphanomyces stellatus]